MPLLPRSTILACARRHLHRSPPVSKKGKSAGDDDAFLFDDGADELFATVPQGAGTHLHSAEPTPPPHSASFDDMLRTGWERLNAFTSHPTRRRYGNPPRRTLIQHLCAAASSPAHLPPILDLVAALRSARVAPAPHSFFERCVRLREPQLALRALQDRPKYGLDIPSLAAARALLNALALPRQSSSSASDRDDASASANATASDEAGADAAEAAAAAALRNCLALAELYPLYGLPRAVSDPVSAVILAGAVARATAAARAAAGHDVDSATATPAPASPHEAGPEMAEDRLRAAFATALVHAEKATEATAGPGNVANATTWTKREARWLRRSMHHVVFAAKGDADDASAAPAERGARSRSPQQPWVREFNMQLRSAAAGAGAT